MHGQYWPMQPVRSHQNTQVEPFRAKSPRRATGALAGRDLRYFGTTDRAYPLAFRYGTRPPQPTSTCCTRYRRQSLGGGRGFRSNNFSFRVTVNDPRPPPSEILLERHTMRNHLDVGCSANRPPSKDVTSTLIRCRTFGGRRAKVLANPGRLAHATDAVPPTAACVTTGLSVYAVEVHDLANRVLGAVGIIVRLMRLVRNPRDGDQPAVARIIRSRQPLFARA
ncbi:hypothetical protein K461DRAFT_302970 [Myriangium duriaei CBS 260.36]|uniref:Uncharacterized protein n=1 Tax=Myriangium duriaei CBS 260.36 TaxID=1168546 RepID=A0A9P4ISV1_9PEZI|nr:hypothetical protein K461DRAFT_302970 [Myriangium duriaei CBS 260.36]